MIGVEMGTDSRVDAGGPPAGRLDLGRVTRHAIHVGRGATQIGDDPGETGDRVADGLDLAQDGVLGAVLDDSAFMLGNRTEGAAPEATPHDGDREADHLVGGDARLAIGGMGYAGIGSFVDAIHLGGSAAPPGD